MEANPYQSPEASDPTPPRIPVSAGKTAALYVLVIAAVFVVHVLPFGLLWLMSDL
jgi:hypothetical protein